MFTHICRQVEGSTGSEAGLLDDFTVIFQGPVHFLEDNMNKCNKRNDENNNEAVGALNVLSIDVQFMPGTGNTFDGACMDSGTQRTVFKSSKRETTA